MRTNHIYRTLSDDIIYVNNVGDEFLLTEAESPIKNMTYDIIVAFKIVDDSKGFFEYDDNPIWFYGASGIQQALKGDGQFILDSCSSMLDSKEKTETSNAVTEPVKSEVFYTGGGIWCGITQLEDGVFMGELNSWGGIWKTEEEAIESYIESDGFVREVNDKAELKAIWEKIYADVINSGNDPENIVRDCYLPDLDKDLEEF